MLKEGVICALHGFSNGGDSFLALDLPGLWTPSLGGHGPAPTLDAACFEDEVRRLAKAIEARSGGAPVRLVGYSMGARLGLGLLLEAPHLFSSALLMGANPGLKSDKERQERREWESGWEALLLQEGIDAFVVRWGQQTIFETQRNLPAEVLALQQRQRQDHKASGLAYALRVLGLGSMPNYWPRLSQIQVPVQWVVGASDEKFVDIGRQAKKCNARFALEELPGVGHNPLVEAPAEIRRMLTSGMAS